MQNNYIIKRKDTKVMSVYYKDSCVRYRIENRGWGKEEEIICNVTPYFTANMSESGELYFFCQNMKGDILICSEKNGKWEHRVILENSRNERQKMLFYSIMGEDGMSLIYNIPSEKAIIRQSMEKGHWKQAEKIDDLYDGDNKIFSVQKIRNQHSMIFYQKKTPELHAGYKEITQSKSGSFNSVYSTGYNITDSSYVIDDDCIHFLCIVKGIIFNQVVYRKRDSSGFSRPVVLFEGQGLKSCMIQIIKNKLYCCWLYGGGLLYRISENKGEIFQKTEKYRKTISKDTLKANYIEYGGNSRGEFICSEVYINKNDCSEIYFINDFLCNNNEKEEDKREENESENERLKNQLMIYKEEIEKKERMIADLNEMMKLKNAEIIEAERKYKKMSAEKNDTSDI